MTNPKQPSQMAFKLENEIYASVNNCSGIYSSTNAIALIDAATADLMAQADALREALGWYADDGYYMSSNSIIAKAYEDGRVAFKAQEAITAFDEWKRKNG